MVVQKDSADSLFSEQNLTELKSGHSSHTCVIMDRYTVWGVSWDAPKTGPGMVKTWTLPAHLPHRNQGDCFLPKN